MTPPTRTKTTYTATARREGRWWLISVPQLDTAGQARTLAEATAVAQEVIGLYLDVDPETVSVTITVELPPVARDLWAAATTAETSARAIAATAAAKRRQAVQALRDLGISQADAARALSISPQRVSQLVHG